MLLCYIDGKFVKGDEAVLPMSDLIIQRGVGVFEAFASFGGKSLMLTPHMERFIASAKSSGIENIPDVEFMKGIVREGIKRVGHDVRIRTFLTGGDYFDSEKGCFPEPRFFVIFDEAGLISEEARAKGVILEPVSFGRDNPEVKSVDYRATYKMPREAYDILYCPNGEITECGHSNFFLVCGDRIITAPLSRVLKGTTRAAAIELAKQEGYTVEERCPLWSELTGASEAFITGSMKLIVPAVKIGGIVIADGKPGKVTLRLIELYRKYMEQWLE
jgi:branched-chain amino acid aminotransferase